MGRQILAYTVVGKSSLPLRGIETSSRGIRGCRPRSPHCPYEGLKPLSGRTWPGGLPRSSLPLRGIETMRPITRSTPADTSPHCPYEGLKLAEPLDDVGPGAVSSLPLRGIETGVPCAGRRGSRRCPHCPYEGLKPGHTIRRLPADGCPHCPYEGLKPEFVAESNRIEGSPHCPYEGLKLGVPALTFLRRQSSLPLRGIETRSASL